MSKDFEAAEEMEVDFLTKLSVWWFVRKLVSRIYVFKDYMVPKAVFNLVRKFGGGRRGLGHGLWCGQDLDRTQRLLPFVREYPVVYVPTASQYVLNDCKEAQRLCTLYVG